MGTLKAVLERLAGGAEEELVEYVCAQWVTVEAFVAQALVLGVESTSERYKHGVIFALRHGEPTIAAVREHLSRAGLLP